MKHPGGEEPFKEYQINSNSFIDATTAFEDVYHSDEAREILDSHLVAILVGKNFILNKLNIKFQMILIYN
jgi:cytochrome b involved in lipid metabolism